MNYATAKAARDLIAAEASQACQALRDVPGVGSGIMGLTPDAVKMTPAYQAAKADADRSLEALRCFNQRFVKTFAKDIRAERRARVAA